MTWQVLNNEQNIGKWKIAYKDEIINGKGFEEFLDAAVKLSQDINVIYVQKLSWLMIVSLNFVSYKESQFFANGDQEFFWAFLADNVELRNWDNFWNEVKEPEAFLGRLEFCRTFFNKGLKGKLGLKNHYKYSLAKDMKEDIEIKYNFYCSNERKALMENTLPQDYEEYRDMLKLNRASFYYSNAAYHGGVAYNLHCYDISSSHISFITRKKYPYEPFKRLRWKEGQGAEMQKIILEKYYCFWGCFAFQKLQYKGDFKLQLCEFGFPFEEGQGCDWELWLWDTDLEWFCKNFTWENCHCIKLYYAPQRELRADVVKFVDPIYNIKNIQEKGTFEKEICKFRAEVIFGQSIKQVEYTGSTIYNEETNRFDWQENAPLSFEEVQAKLKRRPLPFYIGLKIVAYSRIEEYNMMYNIGFNNIIYGDTDSVKFVGEEGIKVIEQHNKEIEKEYREISKKRHWENNVNYKLGQWCKEPDLQAFKAIGIKWYITLDENDKIDIKAAGANKWLLREWAELNEDKLKGKIAKSKTPLLDFNKDMHIPGLFARWGQGHNNSVYCRYDKFLSAEDYNNIQGRFTSLYYYEYKSEEAV